MQSALVTTIIPLGGRTLLLMFTVSWQADSATSTSGWPALGKALPAQSGVKGQMVSM